jgi:hypothetical protein
VYQRVIQRWGRGERIVPWTGADTQGTADGRSA